MPVAQVRDGHVEGKPGQDGVQDARDGKWIGLTVVFVAVVMFRLDVHQVLGTAGVLLVPSEGGRQYRGLGVLPVGGVVQQDIYALEGKAVLDLFAYIGLQLDIWLVHIGFVLSNRVWG